MTNREMSCALDRICLNVSEFCLRDCVFCIKNEWELRKELVKVILNGFCNCARKILHPIPLKPFSSPMLPEPISPFPFSNDMKQRSVPKMSFFGDLSPSCSCVCHDCHGFRCAIFSSRFYRFPSLPDKLNCFCLLAIFLLTQKPTFFWLLLVIWLQMLFKNAFSFCSRLWVKKFNSPNYNWKNR